MGAPEELASVCFNKQPVYYNDAALAWEQRLAMAYDEATKHLKSALPAGTTIDASQYEVANDAAGNQIDTYGSAWLTRFKAAKDADPEHALKLPSNEMRQYYLGRYAQASANLGGYLTGYAREQIPVGAISQADFDQGAEIRLRGFSEIIHAGRTGQLPALVSGEQYAAARGGDSSSVVLVSTPGVSVSTPAAVAGLGEPITIGTWIIIGAIAALIVAGTVVGIYWSSTSSSNRRAMLEICQDAIRRRDPRAEEICKNMATVVADMAAPANMPSPLDAIISREGQQRLISFAAIGAGIYLLVTFAPEIIRSLGRAKSEWAGQQEQIANLARISRRAGRW